jgi:uroporphyrin-III C-methyltransferase/precorrin-2 dehydrogenase/sirohydrochlorin ferrochelatase
MTMAALYPVFLKLDGLPVLVVGGGVVAAGKLDGLIAAGAHVTLVAPAIAAEARKRSHHVRFVEREFRDSDLDGARWVVAAATPEVNRAVSAAAAARKLFVNAVDDPGAATAYLGGVVRRGDVTVAISTLGIAPALAGLLREALDALLPHELERWLEVAHDLRGEWKRGGVPFADRRPLLLRALDRLYARTPRERIQRAAMHGRGHRPSQRVLRRGGAT